MPLREDATARLAMVLHFHQPVGNLDEVIERCCDRCYAPFLRSLESNPDVPATLHFSGCLLEWLEARRPELIEALARLTGRGQVEMQTGGFYEPILAVLPPEDVAEQIGLETDYIRRQFGVEPTGLWLTERVWEPHLPEGLARAGVRYVVLDDTIFRSAGLDEADLIGSFETEHLGHAIRVYPGAKRLRYAIPFEAPAKTVDLLRETAARQPGALLTYADDGEKFGEWPGTSRSVYDEGWLERFWEALRAERSWLELVKLGDHERQVAPRGRVYLPTASYDEMMIWSLPPHAQGRLAGIMRELDARSDADLVRPFVRGATWRSFFARYPEADELHKRTLGLGARMRAAPAAVVPAEARRDLLRAECNCAYWHGVFGGLYLVHLRNALWRHLIRAEAALDRAGSFPAVEPEDGRRIVLLRSEQAVAAVDLGDGGTVTELDDRSAALNVLSVIARRPEAYHAELAGRAAEPAHEEDGGSGSIHERTVLKAGVREVVLAYDRHRRGAFVDWLLPDDLPARVYGSVDWPDEARRVKLAAAVEGGPGAAGARDAVKRIALRGPVLAAAYAVGGVAGGGRRIGVEVSLQLGEPGHPERALMLGGSEAASRSRSLAVPGTVAGFSSAVVRERPGGPAVQLSVSTPCDLWWFPVETVSASESGLERTAQGTSFLLLPAAPIFTVELALLGARG